MTKIADKAQILSQIAQINRMERGKISRIVFKDRSPQAGPFFKLQYWDQGKNHTRHVPPEQLEALQEAVDGYAQFQDLTEQYAQLVMTETRSELRQLSSGIKKRSHSLLPPGPRPRNSTSDGALSGAPPQRGGGTTA